MKHIKLIDRKKLSFFKNERVVKLFSLVSACAATLGLAVILGSAGQNKLLQGELFFIPICAIWYCLYKKLYMRKHTGPFYIFTIIFSFLFSASFVLGIDLDQNQLGSAFHIIVKSALLAMFWYPILAFLTDWIENRSEKQVTSLQMDRKKLYICCLLVVAVWFMGWLALFPGVYGIDAPTWYQMWDQSDTPVSSQWSVLISGLFYFFTSLGVRYFNSPEIGFGIYSFLQMSFVLFVVWKILVFLNERLGKKAVIVSAIFFAFVPTHMIMAVSSAQDAPFAACFAMCCIELFKIFENPTEYWEDKRNIVRFVFWMCLMCIIRNNGLYAIFVMAVLALFFLKHRRKNFFGSIAIITIIVLLYQGPVYNILHVQKGTAIREMLSIPLEQMAAAYNYDDDLSDSLKEQMEQYVSEENMHNYALKNSDPIKNNFKVEKFNENPVEFIKLYFQVGIAAPKSYFYGVLMQTYGLWYPDKEYPDPLIWHPYINYICIDAKQIWGENALEIKRESLFPAYERVLRKLFGDGEETSGYGGSLQTDFVNIPFLSTACRMGTYFWIVVYIAGYGLYKKWKEQYLIVSLAIGLTLTVFLSPLMYYRYYAPVIFSMPVILTVLLKSEKSRENVVSPDSLV